MATVLVCVTQHNTDNCKPLVKYNMLAMCNIATLKALNESFSYTN